MNCGNYTARDLYRNASTGQFIELYARGETIRDAPAYLRTNIPAKAVTVRGLGDDYAAPIYRGYVYLPRPVPRDYSPYVLPMVVVNVPDYSTLGQSLYGASCASFAAADRDYAYPWPWRWSLFSDDFLGRFGVPPRDVPEATICRPQFVLGWWGGRIWQALPMETYTADTKGGGGYLVMTTATLGGYMLPALSAKTLISPPVPPSSLPYLRTALYSQCLFLREYPKDFARREVESVSIEDVGGDFVLKISMKWPI